MSLPKHGTEFGQDRAVRFVCRNLGAPDLPRRGLTAESAPLGVLLLDIEADLVVMDGPRTVWSEERFPVAELARALCGWLRLPDDGRGDFTFDSMSYDVPGAIRIAATGEGWRVGSVFSPEAGSSAVAWETMRSGLVEFIEAVQDDVTALGIDPNVIRGL